MTPDTPLSDPQADLPRMSLPEHLDELRVRIARALLALFVAMVVAFVGWEPLWEFVRAPFDNAAKLQGMGATLQAISPGEGFLSVLKLSFLAGAVLAAPVVLWQLWGFVAAGLYRHERRIVRMFFPVSLGLFALGVVIAYMILIPFGLRFLIGWNVSMGVATDFRIEDYLSTCLTMVFGMALLFELPLVMLFLQATDIVSAQTFKKGWRFAVLFAFVVGMFLTDPSPVTQIMMAVPVVGLYFLGIWGGLFVGPSARRFRWYHTWPLILGAVALAALLVFADEINDWSAKIFGADQKIEAPAEPAEPVGTSEPDAG